ncbi:MAG: cellulase family glycosylhydrolase [Solobacterium sp.]|nr:cellulase family glycosylhydrolase [Solobacterium sp.]
MKRFEIPQWLVILVLIMSAGVFVGCGEETEDLIETKPAEEVRVEEENVCSAVLETVNAWEENGRYFHQYSLRVQNDGPQDVSDWSAEILLPGDTKLEQAWNIETEISESILILRPVEYNRVIPAGEELKDVGWIMSCGGEEETQLLRWNGSEVRSQKPSSDPEDSAVTLNVDSVPIGALHVEEGRLVNVDGNPVQLRGISTHGLAWYPEYVNKDAFRTLRDEWNVNTIRLAMYTAETGGYCTDGNRENLLHLIDEGVRYTEELGMYVIIDWHILSDSNPNTYRKEAEEFFDIVSKAYEDKTHVIYEICNEPQNSPFREVIRPYAEDIIDVIRRHDSDALILVGTNTWAQDVDEVIGNELEDDNVMYTFHFYAGTHKEDLRNKLRKVLDAGVPVYISECSLTDASGNGAVDYDSAEEWRSLIEAYGLSWNAWSLCNKNETSALIQSSCAKTSAWEEEDLSETGRWFKRAFTGESK